MYKLFSDLKALVIDDFAEMRLTIRRMLDAFGVPDIDDCGNGDDALALLAKKRYDFVLCDYNLGHGKDGQQVLEEARHRDLLDFSGVFMMITAENTSGMVLGAVEYEPDDYLTKPFTKELLQRRLERLLEYKRGLEGVGKALREQDYQEALRQCDRAITQRPRYRLPLLKGKGQIWLAAKDYGQAAALYQQVLAEHDVPWARMGLGKAKYLTGAYEDAKHIFAELVHKNPLYVEPYDWLAKTYEALELPQRAREILKEAAAMSPKVIVRRQNLADIALKTGDVVTAEASYKAAMKLGRSSAFRRPQDVTGLAQLLAEQKRDRKALGYLAEARAEYGGNAEALVQFSVLESRVHRGFKRDEQANAALERCTKLYQEKGHELDPGTALDLAGAYMEAGQQGLGEQIVRQVISNHHDEQALVEQAKQIFREAGREAEGAALVNAAVDEVIEINNRGARLANEGQLDQALVLFEEAIKALPQSRVVNMNAARAMLMHMRASGVDPRHLYECRRCLERVQAIDPDNERLRALFAEYHELARHRTGEPPAVQTG